MPSLDDFLIAKLINLRQLLEQNARSATGLALYQSRMRYTHATADVREALRRYPTAEGFVGQLQRDLHIRDADCLCKLSQYHACFVAALAVQPPPSPSS
jgi:hypothetical protein